MGTYPRTMRIKQAFSIALSAALFLPLFLPQLHLLYFIPYLVVCLYRLPRYTLLWHAMAAGMIIDLLSGASQFGIIAINYCATSMLLYRQKYHFFEDKLLTLPLVTTLFSIVSTLISLITTLFFSQDITLNTMWFLTDLLGMSCVDGIYAFLLFSLPRSLWTFFGGTYSRM